MMDAEITKIYGNKVRVRVCGICRIDNQLVLVNHKSLAESDFWIPPGGGVEFGESLQECLRREFLEETGLHVKAGAFLFGCEFIKPPLHAIELFFETFLVSGTLKTGQDPEIAIIRDVKLFSEDELTKVPQNQLHSIFNYARKTSEFGKLRGFYRI